MYNCARGTSDLEGGLHQKLAQKIRSWNAGVDYMDPLMSLFIYRHNVRASLRHRLNFTNLGHYDYTLAYTLKRLALEIGIVEYPSIKPINCCRPTDEQFGVCPPPGHLDELKDNKIAWKSVQAYRSRQDRYVCLRQRSLIPYYPVQTKQEQTQFMLYLFLKCSS